MAVKTIETRAVISAQDQTGTTFAAVAAKLRGLEGVAAQASKRMDGIARGMTTAFREQQMHLEASQRIIKGMQPVGAPGFWQRTQGARQTAVEQGVLIGAAAAAAAPIVKEIVRLAAQQLHENIRMSNAGMSEGEIEEAGEKARELSRKYKSVGQTDIAHMLRNERSVVGSYEEAAKVIEKVLQLRVLTQHANPHASTEEINEQTDKLIKAAELAGVTQNLEKFQNYMQGVAKAINVFGDTIKPYEFFEAAQYGRAATMGLSPEFTAGVLPTMIQHHGGAQAGTTLSSFYSSIVGGKMSNVAANELYKLGLLDKSKIVKTSTGNVKGVAPGGILGSDLARTDPDKWIQQYLKPALDKAGVTDPAKIAEIVAHMFSNRIASQFVTEQLTQHGLYEKDRALTAGAKGLEAVKDILGKDFDTAVKSATEQFKNLEQEAGKPFLQPATDALNAVAEAFARLSKVTHNWPTIGSTEYAGVVGGVAAGGYLGAKTVGGWLGLGPGLSGSLPAFATLGPLAAAGGMGAVIYNRDAIYGGLTGKSREDIEAQKAEMEPWIHSNFRMPWDAPQAPHEGASSVFNRMRALDSHQAAAPVHLEGSAGIDLKIKVEADKDSVVKEVTQAIRASGNLRDDTGTTMAPTQ